MALLDEFYTLNTLTETENGISAEVTLNHKHRIFNGHFPENPVVPGVCMMQMIKEVLQLSRNKAFILSEGSNIKFMNILNPGENAVVELVHEIIRDNGDEIKLRSTIRNKETIFIKFAGTFREYMIKTNTDR